MSSFCVWTTILLEDDRFKLCGCCLPPPPLPDVDALKGLDSLVTEPKSDGRFVLESTDEGPLLNHVEPLTD